MAERELHVEVDATSLHRLIHALNSETDGRALKRDLAAGLRRAMEPAQALARGAVMSMESTGITPGAPLRATVAGAVKTRVRLASKAVVVGVSVSKNGMPRGFRNAPNRLNSRKGWRHPVYGTGRWVVQFGKPGWFDDSMAEARPQAEQEVEQAMRAMAERISARSR